MESGKIEFAPDYKSKSGIDKHGFGSIESHLEYHAHKAIMDERERLRDAVVEAAKGVVSQDTPNWDKLVSYRHLCAAVDALLEFEAKQKEV
jgi:hypothetical protein